MTRHFDENLEEQILDWHLDQLSAADRDRLEARLEADPELARKSDILGRKLRPLDHWTVPTSDKAADRVLNQLRQDRPLLTLHTDDDAPSERESRPRLPRGWKEFLAAAACIAFLLAVFAPAMSQVREQAKRVMCASNLSSIAQGTRLYQASFGGSLPFAGNPAPAAWLPSAASEDYASNSRHVYLLARLSFGPKPDDFLCPADADGDAMPADRLADYHDFATTRNISYDALNLSGSDPNLRPAAAIAYLGDRNPLFRGGRFDGSVDPAHTNSPAHRGHGQTVLTLDGSATWMTSPVVGPRRDNVWTIDGVKRYAGTESPGRDDDAQLVPGYPETDPQVREILLR